MPEECPRLKMLMKEDSKYSMDGKECKNAAIDNCASEISCMVRPEGAKSLGGNLLDLNGERT
jgi:hypothetical protein